MSTQSHSAHTLSRPRRAIAAALVMLSSVAGAAGPAAAAPSQARTIDVRVDRAGVHAPQTLRPGYTTFRFTVARGVDESGALRLVRLNSGVTYEQIGRYMQSGDIPAIFHHVTGYAGLAHSGLALGRAWTTRLSRGQYLLVDDEAGLASPLVVAGNAARARAPRARGTIVLTRHGALLPKAFGNGTWRIVNHDALPHELGLIHILGRHSRADVIEAVTTGRHPAWAAPVGTINALGRNASAWVTFRHMRGAYLTQDWLPMLLGAAQQPLLTFRDVN